VSNSRIQSPPKIKIKLTRIIQPQFRFGKKVLQRRGGRFKSDGTIFVEGCFGKFYSTARLKNFFDTSEKNPDARLNDGKFF